MILPTVKTLHKQFAGPQASSLLQKYSIRGRALIGKMCGESLFLFLEVSLSDREQSEAFKDKVCGLFASLQSFPPLTALFDFLPSETSDW